MKPTESVSETYGKQEESSAHNRRTDRPKSLKTSCWGGRNPGIGADSKITGKNSDALDTEGGARRYNRQHSDVWSGSRQFQMGNSGLVNRKHLLLDFPAMSPQILLSITFVLSISVTNLTADQLKYVVQSKTDWEQAQYFKASPDTKTFTMELIKILVKIICTFSQAQVYLKKSK